MKLKVYQNDSVGDELCPACGMEFPAPFSMAVCVHCGLISFGCNMCPLDYNSQRNEVLKATCNGNGCPAHRPVENLYAIFSRKELQQLPRDYVGEVSCGKNKTMQLLVGSRIVPVYTGRKVIGITTIDLDAWRNGNRELKGVPTIYNIMGDELE
jgi:hypothetical protein